MAIPQSIARPGQDVATFISNLRKDIETRQGGTIPRPTVETTNTAFGQNDASRLYQQAVAVYSQQEAITPTISVLELALVLRHKTLPLAKTMPAAFINDLLQSQCPQQEA